MLSFFDEIIEKIEQEEKEKLGFSDQEYEVFKKERDEKQRKEHAIREAQIAREKEYYEQNIAAVQKAYGNKLGLGVPATIAYAVVLSGLTEQSNGCGHYKKSVHHIRVLEDYKKGRLVRKAGEYLCRKGRPKFDTQNLGTDREVSCPRCRKMAGID